MGDPPLPVANICIAGAAILAGQPVYQFTDGLFYLADANGADPLYKVVGLAENNAGIGQPVSIVIKDPGFTPGFAMVIGDIPILSANVGKICPSSDMASGMFISVFGVAYSIAKMDFDITRSDVARP